MAEVKNSETRITLIGSGTIGLSLAALHLAHLTRPEQLCIYDTRSDIREYVHFTLPQYLPPRQHGLAKDIRIASTLESAVENATIIQEQGPESLSFKSSLWPEVEKLAPGDALFWSSTSGIPASAQAVNMKDPSRLLVVHPYNPPHIMPLLELVPSSQTDQRVIDRTLAFWRARGRSPVVIKKEYTGFVANRLAFALLRESIHLVNAGLVTVEELDRIVETSMGPRWAVSGPFKSYHAGGGKDGLEGFFRNIGGTVQRCWDDSGKVNVGDEWEKNVFQQTREIYGDVDVDWRDRTTKKVLEAVDNEKSLT
ncbi:NAD(P)-binding protein [Patellaria atrata CBS 101060]|uniref:L-gulonate 3-dehydrogenase n=1 Tax=Patellaria atrata CBS 101060 TaxID=1346257 RepID=A0A9P4VP53_9PEZI|nr:NAD(P)-binding protein [Patellaria atrata CBS 101060]